MKFKQLQVQQPLEWHGPLKCMGTPLRSSQEVFPVKIHVPESLPEDKCRAATNLPASETSIAVCQPLMSQPPWDFWKHRDNCA